MRWLSHSPLLLLVLPAACMGTISGDLGEPGLPAAERAEDRRPSAPGDPAAPGQPGAAPAAPAQAMDGKPLPAEPAVRPLHRLSRVEYDNTVRDLLGDTSRLGGALPVETRGLHGFEVPSDLSPLDALVLQELAERLATAAVKDNLAKLVPCALPGDDACGRQFVARFGKRAFRRPLLPEELAALEGLYTRARTTLGHGFGRSVELVIGAVLQAPQFLYHWEVGPQAPRVIAPGKAVALTPYEIASRLSYLVVGSMPDDELLAAADSGALEAPATIAAQARRLLASPRAREGLRPFFRQWWDLERIEQTDKAKATDWPQLRTAMRAETERFIEEVVLRGDGTIQTLLTADYTFVDDVKLAALYGVTLPPTGTSSRVPMQKIALAPGERAGLLTQGSIMAAQAKAAETAPVKRGELVLEKVLCIEPPSAPDEVPELPAPGGALRTLRQRAEEHRSNPACAGCHSLIDPLGFAFEHYDNVARYRTQDNGAPVDASGRFAIDGEMRSFESGVELARTLAASAEVRGCAARQVLRYALGRGEVAADAPLLADGPTPGNLRELLVALAQSRSFTQRAPSAGEVLP